MRQSTIIFLIIVFSINSYSQTITTAVPFLRIPTDARSTGMGDIGLATSPDAASAFFNPGKLPFNQKRGGLAASYSPWLKDISKDMFLASIYGYHKLDSNQSIHSSLRYFSMGDIQFSDDNGNHLNTYTPKEWSFDLGYSRKLSEKAGLGITFRYIHSALSNSGASGNEYNKGSAFAVDLGYFYDAKNTKGNGWSFGAALTNLGSKITYLKNAGEKDFIPANLALGTCYTHIMSDQNRITLGLDINKLLVPSLPATTDSAAMAHYRDRSVIGSWFSSFGDAPRGFSEEVKEFQISTGVEYNYNELFSLRAGYNHENKNKGNRRYFTVGAGVQYNLLELNFSYLIPASQGTITNPLSNTLRFTLILQSKN